MQLLTEIEGGCLEPSVPLSDILRKVVMLGGHGKSPELTAWATAELKGYTDTDVPVPEYRVLASALHLVPWAQGVGQGAVIPLQLSAIPEKIRGLFSNRKDVRNGVSSVEELIRHAQGDRVWFEVIAGEQLAAFMTTKAPPMVKYLNAAEAVHVSAMRDILSAVRNKLVELVAQLLSTLPDDHADLTPAGVAQAVKVVIPGTFRGNLTINTNQAHESSTITKAAPKIHLLVGGRDGAGSAPSSLERFRSSAFSSPSCLVLRTGPTCSGRIRRRRPVGVPGVGQQDILHAGSPPVVADL